MVRNSIFVVLLFVSIVGGCQSSRDWTQIGRPSDYPFHEKVDKVVVAVEPWTSWGDLQKLFRKQPGNEILILRLTIFNEGEESIRFSSTQAEVRLPDGTQVRPMTPGELASKLETNEAIAAYIISIGTLGYGNLIATAVAEGTREENWKSQQGVRDCAMTLATLDPGEALTGFLFFKHPKSRGSWYNFDSIEFKIRRMPRGANSGSLRFALKLSNLKSERDEK